MKTCFFPPTAFASVLTLGGVLTFLQACIQIAPVSQGCNPLWLPCSLGQTLWRVQVPGPEDEAPLGTFSPSVSCSPVTAEGLASARLRLCLETFPLTLAGRNTQGPPVSSPVLESFLFYSCYCSSCSLKTKSPRLGLCLPVCIALVELKKPC